MILKLGFYRNYDLIMFKNTSGRELEEIEKHIQKIFTDIQRVRYYSQM